MSTVLLAFVVVLLAGFTIRGYRNGLLRTVFSVASLVISLALVGVLHPYVRTVIRTSTPVESMIESSVRAVMEEQLAAMMQETEGEPGQAAEQTSSGVSEGLLTEEERTWLSGTMLSEEQQKDWLSMSGIPEAIQGAVETRAAVAASSFADSVSRSIAELVLNVISYLITFVLVFFIVKLIFGAIHLIGRIPILSGFNKGLGAALGFAEGWIVLWICTLVVTALLPSEVGQTVAAAIKEQPILAMLYDSLMSFHLPGTLGFLNLK